MIYFPTNWGAKAPQNLPNHRVVMYFCCIILVTKIVKCCMFSIVNLSLLAFGC